MASTATVTSGYPKQFSMGSKNLYIWRATDVDDGETIETNLGTDVLEHWVSWTGNPGTQTSAGGHSALAATTGIVTFYPASDNLGVTLFVMTDVG